MNPSKDRKWIALEEEGNEERNLKGKKIRNLGSDKCIKMDENLKVSVASCQETVTKWAINWKDQIIEESEINSDLTVSCLSLQNDIVKTSKQISPADTEPCPAFDENIQWTYDNRHSWLVHRETGLCLEINNLNLKVGHCQQSSAQQWIFE